MSDSASLRLKSLLRRLGLAKVPVPMLVGLTVICILAIALALWHFWPQPSDDFSYAGVEEAQAIQDDSAQTEAVKDEVSETKIAVDVEGAVNNPGLYELAPGSRVGDAVEMAGGMTDDALAHGVNRAAKLEDGMQVYVPSASEETAPKVLTQPQSAESVPSGKVSLNSASASELQELPGIGPSLSQRIIDYRQENGGFSSVDDLKNVSGIGEVRFENLKDLICL